MEGLIGWILELLERIRRRRAIAGAVLIGSTVGFLGAAGGLSSCAPAGGPGGSGRSRGVESQIENQSGNSSRKKSPEKISDPAEIAAREFFRDFSVAWAGNAELIADRLDRGEFKSWDDCFAAWAELNDASRKAAFEAHLFAIFDAASGGSEAEYSDAAAKELARVARAAAVGMRGAAK